MRAVISAGVGLHQEVHVLQNLLTGGWDHAHALAAIGLIPRLALLPPHLDDVPKSETVALRNAW
eukprot:5890467-Prorocentrum_lima.AAC.1